MAKNPSSGNPGGNPFDMIYSYSRAQAIEDGVLVDCTVPALVAGIQVPERRGEAAAVALTRGAFHATVRRTAILQDIVGVFAALGLAISALPEGGVPRVDFTVPGADGGQVRLYCVCGPGDDPRPCLTVMLDHED